MKRYSYFLVTIFLFAYVAPLSAQSCDPAVMYTYKDIWFDSDPAGNPLIVGENLTSSCNSGVAAYADASFAMPSGRMTNGAVTYNYGVADAIAAAYLEWSDGVIESGDAILSGSNLLNVPTACFSANWTVRITVATYSRSQSYPDGYALYTLNCPNGNQNATCGTANLLGSQTHLWAEEFGLYTNPGGCFFLNLVQYKDGPPAPYNCK